MNYLVHMDTQPINPTFIFSVPPLQFFFNFKYYCLPDLYLALSGVVFTSLLSSARVLTWLSKRLLLVSVTDGFAYEKSRLSHTGVRINSWLLQRQVVACRREGDMTPRVFLIPTRHLARQQPLGSTSWRDEKAQKEMAREQQQHHQPPPFPPRALCLAKASSVRPVAARRRPALTSIWKTYEASSTALATPHRASSTADGKFCFTRLLLRPWRWRGVAHTGRPLLSLFGLGSSAMAGRRAAEPLPSWPCTLGRDGKQSASRSPTGLSSRRRPTQRHPSGATSRAAWSRWSRPGRKEAGSWRRKRIGGGAASP